MRIFEYRPFLGGLSIGLERFSQNEVVDVLRLPKIATYPYNNTHKQWFLPDYTPIQDYKPQKEYDLAILNPDIGENFKRSGKNNFKINDLCNIFEFLEREKPKFAVIPVDSSAIPLLNIAQEYVRDGFDQLSMDFVIYNLQKMGYNAYLAAIDVADYGVPMHKYIGFYIATPQDFKLSFPKGSYARYSRGKYKKYRTIADAIGDLGEMSEWSAYSSAPQNLYQRYIRRDMPKVTWHFRKSKLSDKQRDVIKQIRPGFRASTTKAVKQRAGYIRPRWNHICAGLDDKFYRVSSTHSSIHPIYDRPFTIREGMRIMGLPDNISFELTTSLGDVANLIVHSISPIIGESLAIALKSI